jgi:hypothetical protein
VFFRHYAQAGVARHEFLLVLHLASYKYESKSGECRPSLATVAREMGYSGERGLQKTLGDLEERGLLRRHYRQGKTTIYDFSGFSRAVLAAARRTAQDEPEDTPELQYTPPPNSSTPEEQEEKKKTKNNTTSDVEKPPQDDCCGDSVAAVDVLNDLQRRTLQILTKEIKPSFQPYSDAKAWVLEDPQGAYGWAIHAKTNDLGGGYLRLRWKAGDPPPPMEPTPGVVQGEGELWYQLWDNSQVVQSSNGTLWEPVHDRAVIQMVKAARAGVPRGTAVMRDGELKESSYYATGI